MTYSEAHQRILRRRQAFLYGAGSVASIFPEPRSHQCELEILSTEEALRRDMRAVSGHFATILGRLQTAWEAELADTEG